MGTMKGRIISAIIVTAGRTALDDFDGNTAARYPQEEDFKSRLDVGIAPADLPRSV